MYFFLPLKFVVNRTDIYMKWRLVIIFTQGQHTELSLSALKGYFNILASWPIILIPLVVSKGYTFSYASQLLFFLRRFLVRNYSRYNGSEQYLSFPSSNSSNTQSNKLKTLWWTRYNPHIHHAVK